ncbi:hypothetical protein RIF29_29372 [Crotalaria pallida]|uniref:Uncharacterized protein n=1 Tax=Crotalaria pallida TaxID=3830 RepID=A0AAN9EEW8_CROPI
MAQEAFRTEAKVSTDPIGIDAPGDFLYQWWSVFWDLTNARTGCDHSEFASAYIESQRTKEQERLLQMQQLQLMQQSSAQLRQRDRNQPALGGSFNPMNCEGMKGQPPTSELAMKMYEDRMKQSNPMATPNPIGANMMALPKSETSHQGHLVHGNMSTALQQIQNNRHSKQHSSSRAANRIATGITTGPSSSLQPLARTPGDGIMTSSSLQHVNNVQKSVMVCGTEGTRGLASSSTSLLKNMEQLGNGNLDDDVESFLLNNGEDCGNPNGAIKQSQPTEQQNETSKGFTFAEFGYIRTSYSKITCCHFSSDGKFLASAGHDNKVVLWNMNTMKTESTPEEHKSVISDVRFRPNSFQFATACMDKSVRLWDATNLSYCVQEYNGHGSAVMSLDFHPKKTDLFCFTDSENEIRYWNMTTSSFTSVLRGGNAQVRFQPGEGKVLAAAYDKGVSIFEVETGKKIYSLQGHPEAVSYICWNANGDVLASVSHNLVKIWSLASGDCIEGLSTSYGNQYHSCVFHPSYSTSLVIGGTSSLELWDMAEKKTMTIPAHDNIISSLVQSPATGMVASASHDGIVKLWK